MIRVTFNWNNTKDKKEVELISHPDNQLHLQKVAHLINQEQTLSVINPLNSRIVKLDINQIEAVEALGHLTKITTTKSEIFHYQKRLKELTDLEAVNFHRINQSTILNLTGIHSFAVGQHARLEIITKTKQTYIVSRHYAKQIKERLSC